MCVCVCVYVYVCAFVCDCQIMTYFVDYHVFPTITPAYSFDFSNYFRSSSFSVESLITLIPPVDIVPLSLVLSVVINIIKFRVLGVEI